MRTLLLALIIALLPLRGWVGDVMALELTAPAGHPPCHEDHAAASAAPHGHALAAAPAADPSEPDPATADSGSCTACQLCHSVALTPVLPPLPAAGLPAGAPAFPQPLYASAEPARGDKPPIR